MPIVPVGDVETLADAVTAAYDALIASGYRAIADALTDAFDATRGA
jgi:hypothetical protein